ncbi:class I SAM-dependent methyltransferase [Alteromonas sp. CYL-A6]|uniref:class I SAM-dependent methyltransferase n=1 Tax=Alteromonas nitratireducens TaxID=3390813 RepID=UPI003983CD87
MQQAIQTVCNEYSQRIFGYHFVRLGELSAEISLPDCPIRHKINQTHGQHAHTSLVSQSHALPFAENSIDGLLLANELDFAQDPHQIVREVDRVITQNGYVIISGFNPLSLTGLLRWLPYKRQSLLHDASFFTAARIKDWLQLLGFEIVEQHQVLYSALQCKHRVDVSRFRGWLAKYLPWCGSVYVILARKRVIPMTAIRPRLKIKPQFAPVSAGMSRAQTRDTHQRRR